MIHFSSWYNLYHMKTVIIHQEIITNNPWCLLCPPATTRRPALNTLQQAKIGPISFWLDQRPLKLLISRWMNEWMTEWVSEWMNGSLASLLFLHEHCLDVWRGPFCWLRQLAQIKHGPTRTRTLIRQLARLWPSWHTLYASLKTW